MQTVIKRLTLQCVGISKKVVSFRRKMLDSAGGQSYVSTLFTNVLNVSWIFTIIEIV